MSVTIRSATPDDVGLLLRLIRELAIYEKMEEQAVATPDRLRAALFGDSPACEAVVARVDGEDAGFALFFQTFSTFTGLPGLWLEDLFVRPAFRGKGAGTALLAYGARLCVERGLPRYEWTVLDWNEPALAVYRRHGATPMSEWTVQRVTGDALRNLAARSV
jgi:GNAT superfamily N-acetyltransferase